MAEFFTNFYQTINLLDIQSFDANQRGEIAAAQQQYFVANSGWKQVVLFALPFCIMSGIVSLAFFPAALNIKSYANLQSAFILAMFFLVLIPTMGYEAGKQILRYFKFRRDLANCAICQGQGQLVYSKKGYAFDLGGSTLPIPSGQDSRLEPGTTYQVYYLAQSKFLLSAAVTHQVSPAQMRAALNDILASANDGFVAEDMLANQQGEVTSAQRRKLFPRAFGSAAIVLGSIILITLLVMPLLSMDSTNKALGSFCVILIFLVVVLLANIVKLIKTLLDIFTPKLEVVQGKAFKDRSRGRHVEYYYTINQERFHVSNRAYMALVDGLEYRLYYLPRSKKLISIEVLKGQNE